MADKVRRELGAYLTLQGSLLILPVFRSAARFGQVAQLVERGPEKAGVGSSILSLATTTFNKLAAFENVCFIEITAVLGRLFPTGIVDRTDLRAVSKNGPCWVDTVAFMTGARVNLQTRRIDNTVGDSFIIQKVSTGETYSFHLEPDVFPEPQAALEDRVRATRAQGQSVSGAEIDEVEDMANALSRRLLDARTTEVPEVQRATRTTLFFRRLLKVCTTALRSSMSLCK